VQFMPFSSIKSKYKKNFFLFDLQLRADKIFNNKEVGDLIL
jgi:hypothetical protein